MKESGFNQNWYLLERVGHVQGVVVNLLRRLFAD